MVRASFAETDGMLRSAVLKHSRIALSDVPILHNQSAVFDFILPRY